MAPIEVFFGVLVFIFALIGVVRGFLRELGVTTVLMFVLFVLSQFEPHLDQGFIRAMSLGNGLVETQNQSITQTWLFIAIIGVTAFISYAGETLSYGGTRLGGTLGLALGLVTGALNGYLIVGTIWYYLDKWNYAIGWLGFSQEELSGLARSMIEFLPLNFLAQPFLLGQSLLLYLSLLLVIARVIR